jgi:hypothetical protein
MLMKPIKLSKRSLFVSIAVIVLGAVVIFGLTRLGLDRRKLRGNVLESDINSSPKPHETYSGDVIQSSTEVSSPSPNSTEAVGNVLESQPSPSTNSQ